MSLCDYSPAYIRAIAPYQPGKPTAELARLVWPKSVLSN